MAAGVALMMTMMYALIAEGQWVDARARNVLDGGAPFYRTYRCADGERVAVGAIEPQFYGLLVQGLGLPEVAGEQLDVERWPAHHAAFDARFATRSRDEWAEHFHGSDACVTSVLSMLEAPAHPHLEKRCTFTTGDGVLQPAAAPCLSRTPAAGRPNQLRPGQDVVSVLTPWGVDEHDTRRLIDARERSSRLEAR